jgi:hypothetical protein
MNPQISVEDIHFKNSALTAEDIAFVRLAAAIIDSPEEVVLAGLLATRGRADSLVTN